MPTMARRSLLAVLLLACCAPVFGSYFLADQVFDAFTFEGVMEPLAVQNLEVTLTGALSGIQRWEGWQNVGGIGSVWTKYYLRVEVNPTLSTIRMGVYYKWTAGSGSAYPGLTGGDWQSVSTFSNLPVGWDTDGIDYYWKLQVEGDGYRLHFNDLQVSTTIPSFNLNPTIPCCQYPLNQDISHFRFKNSEWGGGTEASFDRSAAALFTRDFPCTDPCATLKSRWLFKCDANDQGPVWSPSPPNPICTNTATRYMLYQPAKYPDCQLLTFTISPAGGSIPSEFGSGTYVDNWCPLFATVDPSVTCSYNSVSGIYYDSRCPDPTDEYNEQNPTRRAEMRRRIQQSRRRMAGKAERKSKTVSKSSKSRRSATGYKTGKASGSIDQRHKARHEAFIFNHRYLHPVCWELEELMYLNQNSEHFPALFYWCYDALWCYAEEETCPGSALLPRHVYEARLNACLGVRGTVWTDLQIKEVLLNNFSNSSFELNATNNTIYAVAPIPPSELEDNEPTFLTRLPLYQSIFGFPNCSSSEGAHYGACFFAEGVPDFMYYRYKNMEYLRDWIDGVNYNSWLASRRREYGIPKSKFDHKRYCDVFGYMCDANALCESRRKWPGYRCKCDETKGFYGDGYFCTQSQAFAFVKFKIFTTVGINATLERIADRFENETGVPKEALDISSYVDVDALIGALDNGGQEVAITMKYPTSDNQDFDFAGWNELTDATTPTKSTAFKTLLSLRKKNPEDPTQPLESFNVDRWDYTDVRVYQHPSEAATFKIRYPAPTLSAFQKYTQFEVDVVDGDSSESGVVVEVFNETSDAVASRVNKELDNMQAEQGIYLDSSAVQPVASEPIVTPNLNEDPKPASPEADVPAEQDSDAVAAPMLIAGGSVAGVVVLAVVGWTMHKRSTAAEKEAAVMAVHDLNALEQTTVEVESSPSEDGEDTPKHQAQQGSIKDRWRSSKAGGGEDSFTLSQDRSGIWSGDDTKKKSRPEDSFKKAQHGSGIWNR